MATEIVRGLPMPPKKRKPRELPPREVKYPLEQLDVGDCLIVPAADMPKGGRTSLRTAVSNYVRRHGKGTNAKYEVRPLPDSDDFGVWRIQ